MDREIELLERKLGIRKGQRLPSGFEDDGLEALLGDLGGDGGADEGSGGSDADGGEISGGASSASDSVDEFRGFDDGDGSGDEHDDDDDEEDGYGEDEEGPPRKRQRENPYVPAPTTGGSTAVAGSRYIPPALRGDGSTGETKERAQIKRVLQGLLNRLSESNFLSVVGEVFGAISTNARSIAIEVLIDLLSSLVANPAILSDTFLVLHAAFAAALYRLVGIDFGAVLLKRTVDQIDRAHGHVVAHPSSGGKETTNLIAFLAELYTFRVVGPKIVFAWIRQLLSSLSELNTELLLRMIRNCGPQLRADDPTALKEIIIQIQPLMAETGNDHNFSVRTKFMLETILALKNNRMKGGFAVGASAAELTIRLKKLMGSLAQSQALRGSDPLKFDLDEIRAGDPMKKWWIPLSLNSLQQQHLSTNSSVYPTAEKNRDTSKVSVGPDEEEQSLAQLATVSHLSTPVRRQIFTTLLSSTDYVDAVIRLSALHLTQKQSSEIPLVILHCVGTEKSYNPFYTAVAKKLCSKGRYRTAFKYGLWSTLGRWERTDDNLYDEDKHPTVPDVRKVAHIAKLYAFLVNQRDLDLDLLKTIDWLNLAADPKLFLQVFLTDIILPRTRKGSAPNGEDLAKLREIFGVILDQEQIRSGLSRFLRKEMAIPDLVQSARKVDRLRVGCLAVRDILAEPVAPRERLD